MEPVGDPAAEVHDPPARRAEDDVHAVAAEPRPLVLGRLAHGRQRADEGALRRRARPRQLQQHRLVEARPTPAPHDCPDVDVEAAAPRWLRHGDNGTTGGTDLRDEHAAVERPKPLGSPPPAGDEECAREREPRLGKRGEPE